MPEYSPIREVRVKNFRNIGDVTISFEKSPIVALTGENEAGKTSIVKALAVAGVNAYPTRQARFVRTGTKGFGIAVTTADGGMLVRQKGGPEIGNSLYVKTADGKECRDDKIDRGEGIPVNMQKFMGFVVEPETKEILNVRTYEDLMLFVATPDSTNYKVLYDALKVGQVTRAIKEGNKQANGIKAAIDAARAEMAGIERAIRDIRILDIEPIVNISDRLEKSLKVAKQLQSAVNLKREIESIQLAIEGILGAGASAMEPVDVNVMAELERAKNQHEQADEASRQLEFINAQLGDNQCTEINLVALEKLETAMNSKRSLDRTNRNLEVYSGISEATLVDTRALGELAGAMELARKIGRYTSEISRLASVNDVEEVEVATLGILISVVETEKAFREGKKELEDARASLRTLVGTIKDAGGEVGVCTNCGGLVVVGEDGILGHTDD